MINIRTFSDSNILHLLSLRNIFRIHVLLFYQTFYGIRFCIDILVQLFSCQMLLLAELNSSHPPPIF